MIFYSLCDVINKVRLMFLNEILGIPIFTLRDGRWERESPELILSLAHKMSLGCEGRLVANVQGGTVYVKRGGKMVITLANKWVEFLISEFLFC